MKSAFTLAEVLITLAVIGIVAALTIPSLSNAYQKRVLTTQLQKAYSELSQAGATAMASEMGENFRRSKTLRERDFLGKYVKTTGNASFADTYGAYGSEHNGFSRTASELGVHDSDYSCGKIKSGASVCIRDVGDWMGDGWLDINSEKGPNLIGRDMFSIGFAADGTVGNDYDKYLRSIIEADWDIDKSHDGHRYHE